MKRRSVTVAYLVALFKAKNGVCHICGGKIQPGEGWDRSHVIPLALGGADDATNEDVAHRKCHRDLTAAVDVPNIAKAKRREAAHLGIRKPKGRPMPGSRASGLRKKMDGSVVRRDQ